MGNVQLGGGADTFVFGQGGTLAGNLFLGGGDDLVRVEHGSGTSRIADFVAGSTSGDVVDVSAFFASRSEEHTSELQSLTNLVCRLLLAKNKLHISTQLN